MKKAILLLLALLILTGGLGCVGYVDSDRGGYYERDGRDHRDDRDRRDYKDNRDHKDDRDRDRR